MNPKKIAKVCHEVNRAYCQSLGDNSQPPWEDAPEWMKKSALDGVMLHKIYPDTTPEQSHENWMKKKREDGWVYGKVKDASKKIHPCMVPYRMLPSQQKAKDYIFTAIVQQLIDL